MIYQCHGKNTFVGQGDVEWKAGLPTMVLVHGAGMDRTVWVLLGRYFSRHGYNVVLPDLPGHGKSAGDPVPTIEAMAEWLATLLSELEQMSALDLSTDLVLGGHSMGSLVALQTAAIKPQAVSKLVLLGTGVPMPVGSELLRAAENNEHTAINIITRYSHGYSSHIGHNTVPGISVFHAAEALLEKASPGIIYNDLLACDQYQASDIVAGQLRGKVDATIIAGVDDLMTPLKNTQKLQSMVDARLHVLPECGHMMMSEQPEATLQAMLSI